MNIYVGNLPFSFTELELKETFEEFGLVSSSRVILDRMSGKSRGFGFVEMPNDEEGNKAIEELHQKDFGGRAIIVNEARPKAPSEPGANRY